jgi:hypothetical protein
MCILLFDSTIANYICKVETPIHDSIRKLITWECKEHGVNIMNVLGNLKGSVGRWNLNFWRLEQFYTNFWSKDVVVTCSWPIDLSKRNKGTTVKQHNWWPEKFTYILKIGSSIKWHLPNVKNCHPPSLQPSMWSSGQLRVHCQPLCGAIIGVRIRSLSWIGVSTLLVIIIPFD